MESPVRVDDHALRDVMHIQPEAVDPYRHITALYRVEGSVPLNKMAEESAIENSTGTWTLVGYETLELRKKYGAKIFRVTGSGGSGFIDLASKLQIMIPHSEASTAYFQT